MEGYLFSLSLSLSFSLAFSLSLAFFLSLALTTQTTVLTKLGHQGKVPRDRAFKGASGVFGPHLTRLCVRAPGLHLTFTRSVIHSSIL